MEWLYFWFTILWPRFTILTNFWIESHKSIQWHLFEKILCHLRYMRSAQWLGGISGCYWFDEKCQIVNRVHNFGLWTKPPSTPKTLFIQYAHSTSGQNLLSSFSRRSAGWFSLNNLKRWRRLLRENSGRSTVLPSKRLRLNRRMLNWLFWIMAALFRWFFFRGR